MSLGPQGLGTEGREGALHAPDSPHQLLEGLVHVETQFGRGLEIGHVVGGAEGVGFRSGHLGVGGRGDTGETQVPAPRTGQKNRHTVRWNEGEGSQTVRWGLKWKVPEILWGTLRGLGAV